MLLHIIPRLYVAEPDASQRELISFRCPDLGMRLRNGIKMGREAVQRILIETTQHVRQFTTLTRQAVGADRVINHQMQYFVIDDELDAIADSVMLQSGIPPSLGGFSARWPLSVKGWAPAAAQPRMGLASRERASHYTDRADSAGCILERCEVFQVLTVERGRVLYDNKFDIYARIPTADMTFTASVQPQPSPVRPAASWSN